MNTAFDRFPWTFALSLAVAAIIPGPLATARAATTIDTANKFAYGANLGWVNWEGNVEHGAVIGAYVCSGFIYSANVGWIHLGGGAPANQIRYQNDAATDFGVNHDGAGNLRGFAWGANIGWIHFEDTGSPGVDLRTGELKGYVWSANCGWISLKNAVAHVQTGALERGPFAVNGLPVAWLLENFRVINVDPGADADLDGVTNGQEYVAGTDPKQPDSLLRITGYDFGPGGVSVKLTWSSVPTRLYLIQKNVEPVAAGWTDSGLGLISPSTGSTTSDSFDDRAAPHCYYQVQAVLPLSP